MSYDVSWCLMMSYDVSCWLKVEKFGLQRFAGSDSDIRFYTGFPDYNTLTSFYEFLGPAVTQLNYWGSDFSKECPSWIEKRGPSRKLKPIDELFSVLYRLSLIHI